MHLTKREYLIFLGPTLLILVVMLAFPTVYVLITSFRDYNLTDPAAGNPFVLLSSRRCMRLVTILRISPCPLLMLPFESMTASSVKTAT